MGTVPTVSTLSNINKYIHYKIYLKNVFIPLKLERDTINLELKFHPNEKLDCC